MMIRRDACRAASAQDVSLCVPSHQVHLRMACINVERIR